MFKFKADHPFDQRFNEATKIRTIYPDRLPVIVEKLAKSNVPDLDKHKYLVPKELTIGQFLYVLRKRIRLSGEKALFLFVNNELPPVSAMLSEIYREHKDSDGFLYVTYAGEALFG